MKALTMKTPFKRTSAPCKPPSKVQLVHMFTAPWRASKKALKIQWKVLKWLLLLTLPLTILPIIHGITLGILFVHWRDNHIDKNADAWLYEIKDHINDWSVAGFSFRDFQDRNNDFHITRLNSNDWLNKMGFVLPREYGDFDCNEHAPINKYADLMTLMVDTNNACLLAPPREQWVFMSDYAWPEFIYPWDDAFDSAIQAAYVPSTLNESRLFHANCRGTASFLCGIWAVRSPALLHFLVEDSAPKPENIESGLTYTAPLEELRPVTVRVVELPLRGAYTGLPSLIFPTFEKQILSIMHGDGLFEQFEPWDEFTQEYARFQEYAEKIFAKKGTIMYHLDQTDDWITDNIAKHIYFEEPLDWVTQVSLLVSWALTLLVTIPWQWAKRGILQDFLGQPKKGEWILGEDGGQKAHGSLWEWWMDRSGLGAESDDGFWREIVERLGKARLEKDWPEGKITTSEANQPTAGSVPTPAMEFRW
jgi:hypothetical protein